MATRDHITPTSKFLPACNRIRLSHLIRDPFVAEAFRRAEGDGDFPPLTSEFDNPPSLTGGAAEHLTASTRRVLAMLEG